MRTENSICQTLTSDLDSLFNQALQEKVFPGAAVGISFGAPEQRKKTVLFYGHTAFDHGIRKPVGRNVFFDLASLTKPLATTLAILALIKQNKVSLTDGLERFFGGRLPDEKKQITVLMLLNHCSGLPAHRPYYEQLRTVDAPARLNTLQQLVFNEPLAYGPGAGSLYSDLGFMVLGWIVEHVSGRGLDTFVRDVVFAPLALEEGIFFRPAAIRSEAAAKKVFAATEFCPWRQRLLVGEVSDDNASIVGGVSGQAGLFGNIKSVLSMTTHLLDQWQGREEHPAYSGETLKYFLTRRNLVEDSTWALGFDTPSAVNSSSGHYLSADSVGHLGFTGTSFWIDAHRELVIVLLTNRVHPSRNNEKIKAFRPLFHDTVIKGLELA